MPYESGADAADELNSVLTKSTGATALEIGCRPAGPDIPSLRQGRP